MIVIISAWPHVDLLGTFIEVSLAVDERPTFGPGNQFTLPLK